jgi:hypothetical protein
MMRKRLVARRGRPPIYDDAAVARVAQMIQRGMTHRKIAAAMGIPVASVGNLARKAGAKRTGERRGGSRVWGRINRLRVHQSTGRCAQCARGFDPTDIAGGFCAACLREAPLTVLKVRALASSFDILDTDAARASAIVFAAALLLPGGKVTGQSIRALLGYDRRMQAAIDRFVQQGFFSADGHLCLEECPDDQADILFSMAIMCGAGEIVRLSSGPEEKP